MNIWYISKYAISAKYGFESRHFCLAREFNSFGAHTIVIASDSIHNARIPRFEARYHREFNKGVETWWIRTIRYKKAHSPVRILSWLEFEIKLWMIPKRMLPKPDVVIASSLSLLSILNGYRLKRKYGCKLIFEVRDIWPLTLIEEGGFSRKNPGIVLMAWIEKFGYRHADIIVGTMPNLGEHVTSVMGREMYCRCIPFGFDAELYSNPELLPDEYVTKYIPKRKFIVGYAGTIGLTNALDAFIDCAIEMKRNERIHFILLGDGDCLEAYKKKTLGLKNISFLPKVRKTQVQAVLEYCDVLYFSVKDSKVWHYGLSLNKLIDYMMAAKPIIASYNGYRSMVNEANCGIFIPVNSVPALQEAIYYYECMTPEQLREIGSRGRVWLIENRPYKKIAKDYYQLFNLMRNSMRISSKT